MLSSYINIVLITIRILFDDTERQKKLRMLNNSRDPPLTLIKGQPMFNVYLDDLRIGPFNEGDGYPIWENWHEWIICRSVEQVKFLLVKSVVNNLSLDHDLGKDEKGKELLSGSDLVKWMIEKNTWPKGDITIHSAHIGKALQMKEDIDRYFYKVKR